MAEKMNVYQKLNKVREVVADGIKKGGENKFAKYTYFQLKDILAIVTPLEIEIGLFDYSDFLRSDNGDFQLIHTFVNADDPNDKVSFTIDIPYDVIKGQTAQQAGGSTYSYARRYAWQMIAAVTENNDPDTLNTSKHVPVVTPAQLKKINALCEQVWGDEPVPTEAMLAAVTKDAERFNDLNQTEANHLIKLLEKKLKDK